jgi:hypothetical protein
MNHASWGDVREPLLASIKHVKAAIKLPRAGIAAATRRSRLDEQRLGGTCDISDFRTEVVARVFVALGK